MVYAKVKSMLGFWFIELLFEFGVKGEEMTVGLYLNPGKYIPIE